MRASPIDPRDQTSEVDNTAYRAYFWDRPDLGTTMAAPKSDRRADQRWLLDWRNVMRDVATSGETRL
jgi:hypothetical protein